MKNKETFKCSNALFLKLFTTSALLLLVAFLSMVSIFLLPSGSAKAVSPYDTVINQWDSNSLPVNGTTKTTFEFGQAIGTLPLTTLGTCNASTELIRTALASGINEYYVTVFNSTATYLVLDTSGVGFTQNWQDLGSGNGRISMTSPQFVALWWYDESTIYCTNSNINLARNYGGEKTRPAEINFQLDYPDGYDGQIINPIAPPSSTEVPDLNILTGTGYQVVIQDRNFNTFDQVPFLCNSETTPVMFYELWKGPDLETDVKLTEGVMSPTVPFNYGLPTGADTYRFVAWYLCGPDDIQFSESTQKEFQINQFGSLVMECQDDISGFICTMNEGFNLGIFSTTFNGLVDMLGLMKTINPTYCNTNWIATSNFESDLFPVQNFPPELCTRATQLYIAPTAPYHTFTLWVNILLQGSAILLLVFGLLSIFGFKVRLPSPLEDEADDGSSIRPDIETSSSISRHRATYSKGKR